MATSTLTLDQQQSISDWLVEHPVLSEGLGSGYEACSIASINLALTGELTARVPDCMSLVIGRWIIYVQDEMPEELRNSDEWKELLPIAAGTGRARERERASYIFEWVWDKVLPLLTPVARREDLEGKWGLLLEKRTSDAAREFIANTLWLYANTSEVSRHLVPAVDSAVRAYDSFYGDTFYGYAFAGYISKVLDYATQSSGDEPSSVWSTLDPVGTLRALIEA